MRHLIKMSMVLLASVSVYFVFGFTKEVAPIFVAVIAAGSLVSVYVGLAFADIPKDQQRYAVVIAGLAMAIEAVYGILYAMAVQAPYMFEDPPLWATITLSILHGSPFTVLLFAVSIFVVHSEQRNGSIGNEERIAILLRQTTQMLEAHEERILAMPVSNQATTEALQVSPRASRVYKCQTCGEELSLGEYGASRKHGYCKHCKESVLQNDDAVEATA